MNLELGPTIQRDSASNHASLVKLTLSNLLFTTVEIGGKKYDALPPVIKERIFEGENMLTFRKVFINFSYNPMDNYETLEAIGDLYSNLYTGEKIA
jgi:hypothetical protein